MSTTEKNQIYEIIKKSDKKFENTSDREDEFLDSEEIREIDFDDDLSSLGESDSIYRSHINYGSTLKQELTNIEEKTSL